MLTLTGRIEDVGDDDSSLRSQWKAALKEDIAANLAISSWRIIMGKVRVQAPHNVYVSLRILDTPASANEISGAACREILEAEALSLTGANHTPAMPFVLDGLSLSIVQTRADDSYSLPPSGGSGGAIAVIIILLLIGLGAGGFVYYKKRYKR